VLHVKVFKPEEILVVLFAVNTMDRAMPVANISLQAPANLRLELLAETPLPADGVLRIALPAKQPVAFVARLQLASHGINLKLNGSVVVGARTHGFSVGIEVVDFLRKHKLTTQVFGHQWGTHRSEKKLKVQNVQYKSPQDFLNAMDRDFNVSPVQIIGQEAIVCGRLAQPGGAEKLCLIHSKLDIPNKSIDLTFRTAEAMFTEALHRYWSVYLK